jgi:hypothetical protein
MARNRKELQTNSCKYKRNVTRRWKQDSDAVESMKLKTRRICRRESLIADTAFSKFSIRFVFEIIV